MSPIPLFAQFLGGSIASYAMIVILIAAVVAIKFIMGMM